MEIYVLFVEGHGRRDWKMALISPQPTCMGSVEFHVPLMFPFPPHTPSISFPELFPPAGLTNHWHCPTDKVRFTRADGQEGRRGNDFPDPVPFNLLFPHWILTLLASVSQKWSIVLDTRLTFLFIYNFVNSERTSYLLKKMWYIHTLEILQYSTTWMKHWTLRSVK